MLRSPKTKNYPLKTKNPKPRQPISRVLYPPKRTAIIYLGLPLPTGSSGQPGDEPDTRNSLYSALLRMGLAWTPAVASEAVSSYLTFPPLPAPRDSPIRRIPTLSGRIAFSPIAQNGRYISAALSVGSPRPAVSGHPVRRSSDFPLSQPELKQRPPSRLGPLSVHPPAPSLPEPAKLHQQKIPSPLTGEG